MLSPRALSSTWIAHEWSHVEIFARLGGPRDVPAWFDEGLAVVLSEEPTQSESVCTVARESGVPIPTIEELITPEQWIDAIGRYQDNTKNPNRLPVVYAFAGCEVRRWYLLVGHSGLNVLIEQLRAGHTFESAFASISRESEQRAPVLN